MLASGLLLAALALGGGARWLRDLAGGSVPLYVLMLAALQAVVATPLAWYRGYRLERQFELSRVSPGSWSADYLKTAAVAVLLSVLAAECVYLAMRASPMWWWLAAAAGATALLGLLTLLAPLFVLPLFQRSRPLGRGALRQRLLLLSARAGVPVISVHECPLGAGARRASAALVGAGATRRILLSDTLLDEYTDDEIEVVMAHEIGHHVHRDVIKGLAGEFVMLAGGFLLADLVLDAAWIALGLQSPADVAGLPIVLLSLGAFGVAVTPLLNAWSRRNERRADRFALDMTERPDAFIAAMRRMAAQNLAEEHPSSVARWFFHTHPSIEERIGRAREVLAARGMTQPGERPT